MTDLSIDIDKGRKLILIFLIRGGDIKKALTSKF
jgi:hypothetical protein